MYMCFWIENVYAQYTDKLLFWIQALKKSDRMKSTLMCYILYFSTFIMLYVFYSKLIFNIALYLVYFFSCKYVWEFTFFIYR